MKLVKHYPNFPFNQVPHCLDKGKIESVGTRTLIAVTVMNYIGVCLEWGATSQRYFIVNVYSKCDLSGKRRLWESLVMSRNELGRGAWCVLGDFNAVLHRNERKGVNFVAGSSSLAELTEFGEFVAEMELVDLLVLGRRFTWFHPNGVSMSRIDRVLVSEDWLMAWGNPSLWVLPRSVSDHCPLLVRYNSVDWGPRPFRFNNYWLLHKEFNKVVEQFWRGSNLTGWMAFILKEKLKGLKAHLRIWNIETYGMIDSKIAKLVQDINELDIRSEQAALSVGEVELRKNLFSQMWHCKLSKVSVLAQRSRMWWLREGDTNSRYFHTCINSRGKKNFIKALRVGDDWCESPTSIRSAVVTFFQQHFASDQWCRPRLDGIEFPSLNEEDNRWLVRPFGLEELEKVFFC
ncbi:hypothetical protein QL285_043126 [Trifolium repens]|nr:hypothetical protein QL285_043126 [Trifolium repens]